MKVIKIDDETDIAITKMAKRVGSTKISFVRIVMRNLTDLQITEIWNKNLRKTASTKPDNK